MKLNWGFKILILYCSFVVMMGVLVYKSMQQKFDLVSVDYYDHEIKYQEQIDRMNNAANHSEVISMDYIKPLRVIEIIFPKIFLTSLSGEIIFYKPDDANVDFTVKILPNESGVQHISTEQLAEGKWRIKLSWTAGSIPYYQEEVIFIE